MFSVILCFCAYAPVVRLLLVTDSRYDAVPFGVFGEQLHDSRRAEMTVGAAEERRCHNHWQANL
jgi:hypothetical protein